MSFRTAQERVDTMTMKIEKPTIGSGFIAHPPQVPFAGRVIMQPTTVNPDDIPEWAVGQGGRGRGGAPAGGRGPGHSAQGGQRSYSTGRGYQSGPQRAPGGGGGVPGYHAPRPHTNGPPHPTPHARPAAPHPGYPAAGGGGAPVHRPPPQRPTPTPGVFDTSTLMNVIQQQTPAAPPQQAPRQQQHQTIAMRRPAPAGAAPAAPQAARPPAPAPVAAPVAAPVSAPPSEDKQMSKSQKAKLRKKLRDGKA